MVDLDALDALLADGPALVGVQWANSETGVRQPIAEVAARGAEVREFGTPPPAAGHFLRPSLVLDPPADTRLVTEEQFGPTLPVLPFDDESDVVARANDTWSGLTSSVWTADLDRAAALAARLHTGFTFVNAHGAGHLDERAPFGGSRHSGIGREMGVEGLLEFMETHAVSYPPS